MGISDTFIGLMKDSPWIALTIYLLYRLLKREQQAVDAFKEGALMHQRTTQATESVIMALDRIVEHVGENTHVIARLSDNVQDLKALALRNNPPGV